MQRLHGGASLEIAVLELLRGLPSEFWPKPCKRILDWREHGKFPSSHTGAYNQARQALPLSLVEQSCDRIFDQLLAQTDSDSSTPRAFLLDGTSVRTAHSPALCSLYPPGSNQHREGHWPVLRVLVAHDLYTGLAMRPEWGPMYGPDATSEQRLMESALSRLPDGSTVVGDANFGVFSVVWASARSGHPVLLRLSRPRARYLAEDGLQNGTDRKLLWKPSKADRRSHPELPPQACVEGRLIVQQVQPDNGAAPFLLALFTTLPGKQQEILDLYGQRWAIETDLRSLKSTLCLDQITATTPDMVAKEINIGVATYNLVRAVTCLASEQSGLPPRGYSFTKTRRIMEVFTPLVANAPNPTEAKRIFDQMMYYVHQAKLPPRTRKRPSFPREVWPRGDRFPHRKP